MQSKPLGLPRLIAGVIGVVAAAGAAAGFAVAWRPAIAAIEPPAPSSFDPALVKRGRDSRHQEVRRRNALVQEEFEFAGRGERAVADRDGRKDEGLVRHIADKASGRVRGRIRVVLGLGRIRQGCLVAIFARRLLGQRHVGAAEACTDHQESRKAFRQREIS